MVLGGLLTLTMLATVDSCKHAKASQRASLTSQSKLCSKHDSLQDVRCGQPLPIVAK